MYLVQITEHTFDKLIKDFAVVTETPLEVIKNLGINESTPSILSHVLDDPAKNRGDEVVRWDLIFGVNPTDYYTILTLKGALEDLEKLGNGFRVKCSKTLNLNGDTDIITDIICSNIGVLCIK